MRIVKALVIAFVSIAYGAMGAKPGIVAVAGQYEWDGQRSRFSLSAEEEKLPELMLKSHVQYEYTFENDEFVMYATHHKIIYVNSNESIKKHNRIFISMNSTLNLKTLKARAINRQGKAVYFDETNLKEMKEEESGNAYRIFAMEGVEIGSEVEYFYTRKMTADMFNREFLQFDVPSKSSSMKLSSPRHLKFDFKSYNGLPEVNKLPDTTMNVYEVSAAGLPAIKEEPFSNHAANRQRIEFKLAYNTARSRARLYTWEDAAKRFYEILTKLSKGDQKAVEKFVANAKIDKSLKTADRIKKMEALIKVTVNINSEGGGEALSAPELILKNRVASKEGITKLYVSVFDHMGIKVQPVITCSRESLRFDGDFDTWSYLDDYMLYFPETKGFLAPYYPTRYPLVPGQFTSQKGLFIEPFELGEVKSALGTIKEIPAASYLANQDNLDIDVMFDEGLESNSIAQRRSFVGYTADYFASFYEMLNEEKKKQMVEELIKQTAPDAQLGKWSARPIQKPDLDWFEMSGEFKTSTFIEKAGPRVLFKVGLIIGPQTEMYRDEQRTMSVENDNNRNYDRVIRIHIPAGYTVKNADQLKMDFAFSPGEGNPYLFKSDYVIKGDVLELMISEFYKEIYCPLEKYEDFRKVINAAADFNKVTLILEKAR
ncbi:MAG TPA: DUF3857 domain-containing protein [Cyclobacteriaceae bacterium]|nr:DUF3857 domain-containing protein [Cyclobacteriaceae bacterium]